MTGPEFAGSQFGFEVRPPVLVAYADSLHARVAELATVGEAAAAVRVERGWFGKLPQSGFLADRYAAHQEGVIAEVGELAGWLAAATRGLAESAGRYSAADRVVAGVAGAVKTALGVGIEIPGSGEDSSAPSVPSPSAEASAETEDSEDAEDAEDPEDAENPEAAR